MRSRHILFFYCAARRYYNLTYASYSKGKLFRHFASFILPQATGETKVIKEKERIDKVTKWESWSNESFESAPCIRSVQHYFRITNSFILILKSDFYKSPNCVDVFHYIENQHYLQIISSYFYLFTRRYYFLSYSVNV